MFELLRLAEQNGARIVFSGDTKQIQSVEAGDALRILEAESRLQSASELARKVRPGLHQGLYRGVAAARELASYASRYRSPVVQARVWQLNVKHQPRMEHRYEHSIDR
jgi:hypothetical protein